ncbi:Pentapeptide repeat-containing protein [Halogranum rubrum]|uniref:Pentapeptide repeat-containing protein n=1 Tax=Halogranum rubrum TaxID=553466 RepID=A0A1I4JD73_9EURY|nr:pentapeptide repeat-containing protein [Halogranum rubrum]SFL64519.1 Pentapeptide repeat-containing protein [Halogranum rubrum]
MTLKEGICGHQPDHTMGNMLHKMFPRHLLQSDEDYVCQRPEWNDTGRCILHAEVESKPADEVREALNQDGRLDDLYLRNTRVDDVTIADQAIVNADFRRAILTDVSFSNCYLWDVDFSNAGLKQVRFSNANIFQTYFQGATCRGISFREARLPDTRFDGAHLRGANFERANVEECTFDNTDLRDADFVGAALYHTSFQNARIDNDTDFGRQTWYEGGGLVQSMVGQRPGIDDGELMMHDHRDPNEDPYERAAWQYRMLSQLYRDSSEPEQAREYYIDEKNARRVLYRRKRKFRSYVKAELSRWVTRYGESPWFVVGWSFAVIAAAAVLFSRFGGIRQGGEVVTSDPMQLLYFSVVTFTTLGYGDYQPATGLTQLIASTEALLGALLMALLVFVLGRRVTW